MGLVRSRGARRAVTLEAFCDSYIKSRTDLKRRSLTNLKQAKRVLVDHFGAKCDISSINRGEAKEWAIRLGATLATATVAMHVKKARQFFADAVDHNLLKDNPFKSVKVGSQSNKERQRFIDAATIDTVIEHCPDVEWKLLFALARYGGLRVPSETNALRWTDVHFEQKRLTIRSKKTEHHEGKATRTIPLFPQIEKLLIDALSHATEGATHVIARRRGENLRTRGADVVERAGFTPWPKLFQNLRASRETELMATLPAYVVYDWLGNTETVARKHYLIVRDEHFAQAMRAAPGAADHRGQAGTNGDSKSKNPGITRGSADNEYPQGESKKRGIRRGKHYYSRHALHGALHRLRAASRREYLAARQELRRANPRPAR